MKPVMNHLIPAVAMWLLWHLDLSIGDDKLEEPEGKTTSSYLVISQSLSFSLCVYLFLPMYVFASQ